MYAEKRHGHKAQTRRRRTRAEQVQNRRFVLAVSLVALVVVTTATVSYSSRAEASLEAGPTEASGSTSTTLDPAAGLISATYTAELTGSDLGSASEDTTALLTLGYDAAAQTLSYKLEVTAPLASPSIAAICQGAPGKSGSTVFTIFPGPAVAGNFSGVLAEGDILAQDLVGPLQGGKLTDLVLLITNGGAYATMGTTNRPIDAVRGTLK